MRGWIKVWPRRLADSERVNKLKVPKRWWYIMLIGAAYNDILPGVLLDSHGEPLSMRTLAHEFRTQRQQVQGAVDACLEVDLMREFTLGETKVLAIRKYAEMQADYKKRGFNLDDIRAQLNITFYAELRKSHVSLNRDSIETHPHEIDDLLLYLGYTCKSQKLESQTPAVLPVAKSSGDKRPEIREKRKEERNVPQPSAENSPSFSIKKVKKEPRLPTALETESPEELRRRFEKTMTLEDWAKFNASKLGKDDGG